MIDRHQARILALQSLCQFEALGADFFAQLDDFLADDAPPQAVRDYARFLVVESKNRMEELDAALQTVSENWNLKRMAPVDRNILRVAACELKTQPSVPPKVAITEAVEIAKAFGTAESAAFINGILDAALKKHLLDRDEGETQPAPTVANNPTPK